MGLKDFRKKSVGEIPKILIFKGGFYYEVGHFSKGGSDNFWRKWKKSIITVWKSAILIRFKGVSMVCTRDLIRYIRITFEYENTKVNSTNIFWEGVGGGKKNWRISVFWGGQYPTACHATLVRLSCLLQKRQIIRGLSSTEQRLRSIYMSFKLLLNPMTSKLGWWLFEEAFANAEETYNFVANSMYRFKQERVKTGKNILRSFCDMFVFINLH